MFWIRVEAGAPEGLVITDFTFSQFNAAEMAVALGWVLRAAGAIQPARLIFRDVNSTGEPLHEQYRPILGLYAKQDRRFLTLLIERSRSGKTDLIAEFSS